MERDPSLIPSLLQQAIEAQDRGDEKALGLATADVLRNATPAQHVTFLRGLDEFPDDMRKVREFMSAAVRTNADLPPEQRMTAAPAEPSRPRSNPAAAAAANSHSATVDHGPIGPTAQPSTSPAAQTENRPQHKRSR